MLRLNSTICQCELQSDFSCILGMMIDIPLSVDIPLQHYHSFLFL